MNSWPSWRDPYDPHPEMMWWALWSCTWQFIGGDYYRRMFGARLRGAKFTRELAGCVIP